MQHPSQPHSLQLLLATLVCWSGCSPAPHQPVSQAPSAKKVVTVFAAASTISALDEIKEAFRQQSGIEVQTNYAASSTLAQQIVNGAEPDIFLSANIGWADHVQATMPVAGRKDLLGNRLVIIVPDRSTHLPQTPEDLLDPVFAHLALADPESVPAGKYARQALVKLELWESLESRVVPGNDVRQALTYVETGAAEVGIVYTTDAAVSRHVRVAMEIARELTEPVVYPCLLLQRPVENPSAVALFDYLSSSAANQVFERFGFVVLSPAADIVPSDSRSDPQPREP